MNCTLPRTTHSFGLPSVFILPPPSLPPLSTIAGAPFPHIRPRSQRALWISFHPLVTDCRARSLCVTLTHHHLPSVPYPFGPLHPWPHAQKSPLLYIFFVPQSFRLLRTWWFAWNVDSTTTSRSVKSIKSVGTISSISRAKCSSFRSVFQTVTRKCCRRTITPTSFWGYQEESAYVISSGWAFGAEDLPWVNTNDIYWWNII